MLEVAGAELPQLRQASVLLALLLAALFQYPENGILTITITISPLPLLMKLLLLLPAAATTSLLLQLLLPIGLFSKFGGSFWLFIILRHLICRGTKMGPESWELPYFLLLGDYCNDYSSPAAAIAATTFAATKATAMDTAKTMKLPCPPLK